MRKISEVLRQYHELKCSHRTIAKSLNIGKTTVTRYLTLANVAQIGWPLPASMTEEDLYKQLFMPAPKAFKKKPSPDWEWVHQELRKKGVTLQLLWREYRDVYSGGLGYSQFCGHYRRYLKAITPVMRQVHKGGEKTFVDYAGMTMPWLDPTTGEIHEAEIFVGSLGASQFTFVEATATQQTPDWIQSHVQMWEYFGGVSEVVVPDNLKSGVKKSHRYDPDINANYQHVGEHYGFAIVPARIYEPKDKAKVENAVGIVERQILAPLRHITFTSLAEINAAIKPKLAILNNQSFQKMKTSRRALFEAIDKPALKPLPQDKYHYAEWKHAKIHIDYHFVFDDHYYSVPYKHIHQKVEVRATAKIVECFFQGIRIASHPRSYLRYKHSTLKDHMPPAHRAHAEWSPERIKRWAEKTGSHTMKFIDYMIASRAFPEQAYRACLGVLRLGSKYGADRLEKACSIAYESGATRYTQVELILKNKLDAVPHSHAVQMPVVIASHENIRGSDYYK
jgi:transposase